MQCFGKRVDAAYADAMQTAGYLVAIRIELAACVQFGQNDLRSRYTLFRMNVHRNSAPIVDDGNGIIDMYGDADFGAISR